MRSNVCARKTCNVWNQMFMQEKHVMCEIKCLCEKKHVMCEIKCLCKKNMYCLRSNVCARKTRNVWNQMFVEGKHVMCEIKCLCEKNM